MKHLLSPLDFSVEELDNLMVLRKTLKPIQKNMHMHARAKNLPLFSTNQVHVLD